MAKKTCELCNKAARMFCESDQASLCWDCDEKVHAANFLVAKHSRTLLCQVCRSPTPWTAAGPKLGPTVSVCHACALNRNGDGESQSEVYTDNDDTEEEEEEDEDDLDEDDEEGEIEEDADNQVVPWSAGSVDLPPTSSGGEENVSLSSSKRSRDGCPNFYSSEDEDGCCSSKSGPSESSTVEESHNSRGSSSSSSSSSLTLLRPLKMLRTGMSPSEAAPPAKEETTAAIVEKLRRFKEEIVTDTSSMVLSLCKFTRD